MSAARRPDGATSKLSFAQIRLRSKCLAALAIAALLAAKPARAIGQLDEFYTSPEMQAMGGAGVAIVDDLDSLTYNPAGLAAQRSELELLTVDARATSDIYSQYSTLSQLKSASINTVNDVMGRDLFVEANARSGFIQSGFGLAVISDQQLALQTRNEALPQVTLGYQTTNALVFGYGFKLGGAKASKSKKRKKRSRRHREKSDTKNEFRVGIGGELMTRRGGYYTLTPTQLVNLSETEILGMIGNFGYGYGVNAGTQYLYHANDRLTLMAGMSWFGIGNIAFTSGAETQQGNLSAGGGVRYDLPGLSATFAYDLRYLNISTDYRMREHYGIELGLPLVSVFGGMSQGYPCYGVSTDIWLARITALTYTEELGAMLGQDPQRIYMLRVSIGMGI